LINALAVLSKLSLLEDADWDLSHARQVLDFAQVINQVLVLIKELEAQMVQPRDPIRIDTPARTASQMTQLKERYLSRLAMLEGTAASQSGVQGQSAQVNETRLEGELFEGLDESFWQDIIADWNVSPGPPDNSSLLYGRIG
jgi:hypothetical protein